eukprot:scaffold226741_cov15-Tisochrysis_lutea.AAC.2
MEHSHLETSAFRKPSETGSQLRYCPSGRDRMVDQLNVDHSIGSCRNGVESQRGPCHEDEVSSG